MALKKLPLLRLGLADFQLAGRASIAAVLSLIAARWLGLDYPIYAFLAAVIVTDLMPAVSQNSGLRRIGATAVGALTGALLSSMMPGTPLNIGLGVAVAMVLAQVCRAGEAARVAGYISGIVLLDHSTMPWHYALHRFLETALGVVIAWAISFVPKLIRIDRLQDEE